MIVDLGFLDALGIKSCCNVECIIKICNFAYCVFKSTDLYKLFHPNWLRLLENGKKRIFGHNYRQLPKN